MGIGIPLGINQFSPNKSTYRRASKQTSKLPRWKVNKVRKYQCVTEIKRLGMDAQGKRIPKYE